MTQAPPGASSRAHPAQCSAALPPLTPVTTHTHAHALSLTPSAGSTFPCGTGAHKASCPEYQYLEPGSMPAVPILRNRGRRVPISGTWVFAHSTNVEEPGTPLLWPPTTPCAPSTSASLSSFGPPSPLPQYWSCGTGHHYNATDNTTKRPHRGVTPERPRQKKQRPHHKGI